MNPKGSPLNKESVPISIIPSTYDSLYRLIRATCSDGKVIEYLYDAAGNRLTVVNAPPAQAPTVTVFST
jgi:YD repeat-containing protein